MSRSVLILGSVLLLLAAGVARAEPHGAPESGQEVEAGQEAVPGMQEAEPAPGPEIQTHRIGFWEVDLAAIDYEPSMSV